MKNIRPKIIIFAGTDGAGKTTLIQYLNKFSNYKYFCIDRFFDSAFVYDAISGRRQRTELLNKSETELSKLKHSEFYLVYLVCEYDTLLKRLLSKNETKQTIENIKIARKLYDKYYSQSPLKKIKLNTSKLSESKCYEKIIEMIGD